MKKKKNPTYKIMLGILFVVVGIFIFIIWKPFLLGQSDQFKPRESTTFNSKSLNFSVEVPLYFNTIDRDIQVELIAGDGDGKISIVRNGTNYSSLNAYMSEFDSRRNLKSESMEELQINGYPAAKRILAYPSEVFKRKTYVILVNNAVYILSTNAPNLYDELDQIAGSFKYTGK